MGIMLGWVLGWSIVGLTLIEKPKETIAEIFKSCVTDCANKPYAVGAFKVGR